MPKPALEVQPVAARPVLDRWFGKCALVFLSVAMLTLALAPAKQFYLAWAGLVPWLVVVGRAKTNFRAFCWSWLGGTAFFAANMWWLAYVTLPGMIALLIYLGLYWGFAALGVRTLLGTEDSGQRTEQKTGAVPNSVLSPQSSVLLVATLWTSLEFIRGNLFTGLPWLYLGHTQSPILAACQIADTFGVYGISFCVAALNAFIFLLIRGHRRTLVAAASVVACLWIGSCAYGFWRISQTDKITTPGPTVLVVQPNYPQDNSGEKGAPPSELVRFHLAATAAAIEKAGHADLACWSETMMPALNDYHRKMWHGIKLRDRNDNVAEEDHGIVLDQYLQQIQSLAASKQLNILAGGMFMEDLDEAHGVFRDRRNSAYLIRADGALAAERYDKIHLVPFGEYIPFKHSRWFHWLYTFFNSFSPYDYDYTLTAGPEDRSTVFTITAASTGKSVRLVAPICFEDIDARLCAQMFRGDDGSKRADLIVNLTNDGWFKANENPQHLQAALFRSIENRAPTARSVNTGVSALIDPAGRVLGHVPQGTEGTATGALRLDPRYTVYSRYGDWFATLCALITAAIFLRAFVAWRRTRRRPKA
jgi:apolipoprotein N-acyltransferase